MTFPPPFSFPEVFFFIFLLLLLNGHEEFLFNGEDGVYSPVRPSSSSLLVIAFFAERVEGEEFPRGLRALSCFFLYLYNPSMMHLMNSTFVFRRPSCYGRFDAFHQDHFLGTSLHRLQWSTGRQCPRMTTVDLVETREKPMMSGTDELPSLFDERLISVSQLL